MDARALLEVISEFVSAKDNSEMHPDLISKEQAEAQLNEIASKFEQLLTAN